MARAKPGDWTPGDLLELVDVEAAHGPEGLADVLAFLPTSSQEATEKFRDAILHNAGWLNAELSARGAPTHGNISASLQHLVKGLEAAEAALRDLDAVPRLMIEDAASRDKDVSGRAGADGPRFKIEIEGVHVLTAHGRDRLRKASRSVSDLMRWAAAAQQANVVPSSPGPKRMNDERESIKALEELWREAWRNHPSRRDPTLASFGPFVRAVLLPICRLHGIHPDLTHAIEDVLHRS